MNTIGYGFWDRGITINPGIQATGILNTSGTAGLSSTNTIPQIELAKQSDLIKNNIKMKIFRYKVTIDGVERIVSVGVNKINLILQNIIFTPDDTPYRKDTYYSFAHTILNPNDKYDERIELGRLTKMINSKTFDINIPTMFSSYGAMRSFAFSYCTRIIHEWCETRGIKTKIKVEDYKLVEDELNF